MQDSPHLSRYIHKAEALTKTDLSYLASGGAWLTLGQLGIGLIAFLLSIAFAHFVSKDVYGTYRFLLSVFWTITAFSLTGLPTALSQAVARGFDGAYQKSFRLSFWWGLPLFCISAGMSAYYFVQGNETLGWGAIIIALCGPFMQMSLLYGAFLEGKKNFKGMALWGIVLNSVSGILILGAMFITQNPLAYLAAYLLGNILAGLAIGYRVYTAYRPARAANPELTNLGVHFSIMNVLSTLSQQIDKLLVFHFLGAAQLAIYSFAIALPEQAKTFANSIGTLAFPKFAQRSIKEIEGNFWKRLWLFTLALVVGALLYMLLAPFFFDVFFPNYLDAVWYSQLFAISLIFISNVIPPTLLQAHAANKELYIFNIVTPLFQIGILVVLTISYGLIGVIVARIVARAFALLLGAILVRQYSNKH